jgi:hypothetical protein
MRRFLTGFCVLAVICFPIRTAVADLIIDVDYTGDPQYEAAFTTAAQTWETLLNGYQNGLVVARSALSSYLIGQTVSTVFITANIAAIDGVGGILGQAGPDEIVIDAAGFFLTTDGTMDFDSADVANMVTNGTWENVILHEMAHVLGFGTMWTNNGLYVANSGEFLGTNATAEWQSDFGQIGTPNVELGGGPGTANGHWNEVDGGGGLVGIMDGLGRDMRDELMTGWLNPNSFISDMTVASFVDIGFLGAEATPEPGSCLLASIGLGALAVSRRRRRNDAKTAA